MENKIIEETQFLLEKINKNIKKEISNIDIPLSSLSSDEIVNKVFYQFNLFKQSAANQDPEISKLVLLSKEFIGLNITSIEITHSFAPTFLGDLAENFRWLFEIEFATKNSVLERDIAKTIAKIKSNNENYNENPNRRRYMSIIMQKETIKHLIINLQEQIPEISENSLFLVSSLILYDFERMSASRQYDFLAYKTMHSNSNHLNEWTACMTVEAEYKRPNIIIKTVK